MNEAIRCLNELCDHAMNCFENEGYPLYRYMDEDQLQELRQPIIEYINEQQDRIDSLKKYIEALTAQMGYFQEANWRLAEKLARYESNEMVKKYCKNDEWLY